MFIKLHTLDQDKEFFLNVNQIDTISPVENATDIQTREDLYRVRETPEYIITQSKLVAGLNINGIGISKVTVFTEQPRIIGKSE